MNLIRLQPLFPEVEALRRQMDQIFDELVVDTTYPRSSQRQDHPWQPSIELQDHNDHLLLQVALPGVEGKDLEVQVTKDAVGISGEMRSSHLDQQKNYIRSEFRYGKFQRVINLPTNVVNEKAKAKFELGILTLTLPKQEAQQRTVVKINLGESSPTLEATEQPAVEGSPA